MTPDRTSIGGAAAVLAGGVLVVLDGTPGAVAALALVGCWYVLGPVYAVAVGQVAVAALAGNWSLPVLAGAELAVLAVLVAPDLANAGGRRLAGGTVVGAAILAGIAYGAQGTWETTWATVVVLAFVTAFAAYTFHRYERVATGTA